MDDRIAILKQAPLFADQADEVLADIAARLREEDHFAGQLICAAGEPGLAMYMVKSGEVKIATKDREGKEAILDYLGRGKYFGEMSLLTGESRSADAVTTLDSSLYLLDKDNFDAIIKKYPLISLALSRVLAERLRRINLPKARRKHPPKLIVLTGPLPALTQKNVGYLFARALREESGKKVVFVDFNFQAPPILTLFNLRDGSARVP